MKDWQHQQQLEERQQWDELLESDPEYEEWSKAYDEETLKEREDGR